MKGKKALIFTIDAILALLAASVLIGASFFYLSQVQTLGWSQPSLFVVSMDTLNTLRLDNSLSDAVKDDSNVTLIQFMDNMYPANICGSMYIYDKNSVPIMTANRTGCDNIPTDSRDVFVSRKTFLHNKGIYYAYLRTWYE